MIASRLAPLIAPVLVLFAAAEPALANCSDVAQPGVYWRRCALDGQDLRDADLTGATLRDSTFNRADLSGANLTGIDGRRARFVSTNMRGTVLDEAQLARAEFTNADLSGASLRKADLTMARMFRANLREADFTGARISGLDLHNAQLGGATWVDGVTVCTENSIGTCHPTPRTPEMTDAEPSG
jgi:uncharacterized protein YjbI with pentapeptide repeats